MSVVSAVCDSTAYTFRMNVNVVLLPSMLPDLRRGEFTVVVFDVLRATTTMAAALAASVAEIRIYGSTGEARKAGVRRGEFLLCGEEKCHAPEGFHLGNSPAAFQATAHRGRTVCMSTTNGTRAILAAQSARRMFVGALVNAAAVARVAAQDDADILLLCAGTNGEVAAEDVIGAGAVLNALRVHGNAQVTSDTARIAEDLFFLHRTDLPRALRATRGGQNVITAGLDADIDFAARLNVIDVVGEVHPDETPIVRAIPS
jgi:2-phosphosulfolactate phosphatase